MGKKNDVSQQPLYKKKLLVLIGAILLMAVVVILGRHLLRNRNYQSNAPSHLSPSPQNATAWKLYTNQYNNQHVYTIQYPANYSVGGGGVVEEQGIMVYFQPQDHTAPNDGYGRITVTRENILPTIRNPNESYEQYLVRKTGRSITSAMAVKTLQIDGHEAVQLVQKLAGGAIDIQTFIFIDDRRMLNMVTPAMSNDPTLTIYNQMLSSLKFTPQPKK